MIYTYRFIRAEREPSGKREGWWVVYRSHEPDEGGVLLGAEDGAGRVDKVGDRWVAYFERSEEFMEDVLCKTRDEAAKALIEVHMHYYNLPWVPLDNIYHERQVPA